MYDVCRLFQLHLCPASEARGFTDFEHIEKEYLATIEKLNWPDGVTLPDKLEGEDTGTSFSGRIW